MATIEAKAGVAAARGRGILVFSLSTVLLTAQDAITKLLTTGFSPVEVLFFRGLAAMVPVAIIVWMSGGRVRLRTPRPWVNLWRGAISLATSILVVASFQAMPLAEALAIIFLNPLIVTAASGPMLGERVSARQWVAVGVGLLGAILLVQPSGGAALTWAILIPLGAAVLGAGRDLITRRLGASDHPATVLLYSMTIMLLGSAVLVGWQGTHLPTPGEWLLIVGAAVLVTGAYLCQIVGLKLAAAATIAPYKYLSLVWAALLGWAIWGDVMAPLKLAGCALVVGAGLYLMRSDARR